ncbi:MAG TPA: transporter substrate-binding domain-containing protein [Deltaproteobacteria bacterium]|nr:transporter substrate-binding domain-containing protein [Deltaproteobacteria bacterium]HPR54654.1 transporter substrate-binding domain-containing protein [Deltaproteobacteria bacterium]HXK47214.1 transporter substrate-binding domain-containing protein [Deltaproteobacteria bacterium]
MTSARYLCILFLLCFLTLCPAAHATHNQRVILATGEWPPYTSQYQRNYGIFTEIVSAVFKEMGMKPVYRFHPWKRSEMEVRKGLALASFPHVITPERRDEFHFSEAIAYSTGRMFYNTRKNPYGVELDSIDDLRRYSIGGGTGYRHEGVLRNLGLSMEYVASTDQNIRKLFLRRVDLLPMDEVVGLYQIRRLYPRRMHSFAFAEKPLTQDSLHVMFSTAYPQAAEIEEEFNQALLKIREKGIYQLICSRYGIVVSRTQTVLPLVFGGEPPRPQAPLSP